jgi:TolB protein
MRITFATGGGMESIRVVDWDGSHPIVIERGSSGQPLAPAWSPDGTELAYVSLLRRTVGEIWIMRADGSGRHRVYRSDCCEGRWSPPAWSPDGRYVAFNAAYVDFAGNGTYVVARDGTGLRLLAPHQVQPMGADLMAPPAWQPLADGAEP